MAAARGGGRTRLSPETRRAQLIALGLDMLSTRRLEELSVDLIAKSAGISRGLLFHYFGSKREFHTEVARAAAAEMIRRTETDPALPPERALRSGLAAFVDYVEQNPDNYRSLVRGAASGDETMRAIFDETRAALARRIQDVVIGLGLDVGPRTELALHGWVAFIEECVIRWTVARDLTRAELEEFLTASLPALLAGVDAAHAAAVATIFGSPDASSGPVAAGASPARSAPE